jgi:hypothetical protein
VGAAVLDTKGLVHCSARAGGELYAAAGASVRVLAMLGCVDRMCVKGGITSCKYCTYSVGCPVIRVNNQCMHD